MGHCVAGDIKTKLSALKVFSTDLLLIQLLVCVPRFTVIDWNGWLWTYRVDTEQPRKRWWLPQSMLQRWKTHRLAQQLRSNLTRLQRCSMNNDNKRSRPTNDNKPWLDAKLGILTSAAYPHMFGFVSAHRTVSPSFTIVESQVHSSQKR